MNELIEIKNELTKMNKKEREKKNRRYRVCYRCRQKGHYASKCKEKVQNKDQCNKVQDNNQRNVTCFKCGRNGHYSRDCRIGNDQGKEDHKKGWDKEINTWRFGPKNMGTIILEDKNKKF